MGGQADELKARTRRFALDVIQFVQAIPAFDPGVTFRRQLTRSATSVAANYRASCRARSHSEFTARIAIVAEEADESCLWLDMATASELAPAEGSATLLQEARELSAIFSTMVRTARRNETRR